MIIAFFGVAEDGCVLQGAHGDHHISKYHGTLISCVPRLIPQFHYILTLEFLQSTCLTIRKWYVQMNEMHAMFWLGSPTLFTSQGSLSYGISVTGCLN
jgi:predicted cation transporter